MIEAIDFSSEAPALFVETRDAALSYRELGRRIDAAREAMRALERPRLAFQFCPNSPGAIVAYLACLAERIPLGFGEPAELPRERVIAAYDPDWVFLPEDDPKPPPGYQRANPAIAGIALWTARQNRVAAETHADLALLLATSGSTGDAKFVRLSRANLLANARSIASYLALGPGEVAMQSLPVHYSYGLSILNSHLIAGGAVALTRHSFMRPEFWRTVDECGGTSFAGVPYMYETMRRLRIDPAGRPTVRTLTQAGGHLHVDLVRHFLETASRSGARLFVMYGQTEATARIAYVPPEALPQKVGAIGVAIPQGELWLEPVEDAPDARQLFYRGPNVMLGYATSGADLARGDDQQGTLATGDLAERDEDGFFRITGRLARFAKLFGKRINLAGLEGEAERTFALPAAAIDGGDHLRIFFAGADAATLDRARTHFATLLAVPPLAIKMSTLAELPLTASGKKNYKALA